MADEPTFCDHDWHEKLVRLVQCSLDAAAFSPTQLKLRESQAKLLAKHGRYDVDGDPSEASDAQVESIARQAASAGRARELVCPPPSVPMPPPADWRTPEQRAEHAKLCGVWWLCPDHGLNANAHVLSGYAYCWADRCGRIVLSVGSLHEELTRHAR